MELHCGSSPAGPDSQYAHLSMTLSLPGVQSNRHSILVQWLPEAQLRTPRASLNLRNNCQKIKYPSQLRRILDLKLRINSMCGFTLLKFLYLLAVLGLCCYLPALSRCGKWGLLSSCGARAPPCGGFSCCRAWALGQMAFSHYSSQALQHRLRGCCKACGIFPDQGSNPCPQYWKEHSLPLSHQGSPNILFLLLMVLFCSFHFGDHIL